MRRSLSVAMAAIAAMDLSQIKRKLMEPAPYWVPWTQDQADEAELWYRRYLSVVALKGGKEGTVPNYAVDIFWHTHILDTRAYAADCQAIFGEFLHHNQYFGMNGDIAERDDCFLDTNEMYRKHFGEDMTAIKHFPRLSGSAMCDGGVCEGYIPQPRPVEVQTRQTAALA